MPDLTGLTGFTGSSTQSAPDAAISVPKTQNTGKLDLSGLTGSAVSTSTPTVSTPKTAVLGTGGQRSTVDVSGLNMGTATPDLLSNPILQRVTALGAQTGRDKAFQQQITSLYKGDPAELAAQLKTSETMSTWLQLSPAQVANNYDSAKYALWGEDAVKTSATQIEKKIGNTLQAVVTEPQINALSVRQMMGDKSPELADQIKQLQKSVPQQDQQIAWIKPVASMIYGLGYQAYTGASFVADNIAAIATGEYFSRIMNNAGVAGFTPATNFFGDAVVQGERFTGTFMGATYRGLRDAGVSDSMATGFAAGVGLLQTAVLGLRLPEAGEVVASAARSSAVKSALTGVLDNAGKRLLEPTLVQGTYGAVSAGISSLGNAFAISLDNLARDGKIPVPTAASIAKDIGIGFAGGAAFGAFTGGVGEIIRGGLLDRMAQEKAKEIDSNTSAVDITVEGEQPTPLKPSTEPIPTPKPEEVLRPLTRSPEEMPGLVEAEKARIQQDIATSETKVEALKTQLETAPAEEKPAIRASLKTEQTALEDSQRNVENVSAKSVAAHTPDNPTVGEVVRTISLDDTEKQIGNLSQQINKILREELANKNRSGDYGEKFNAAATQLEQDIAVGKATQPLQDQIDALQAQKVEILQKLRDAATKQKELKGQLADQTKNAAYERKFRDAEASLVRDIEVGKVNARRVRELSVMRDRLVEEKQKFSQYKIDQKSAAKVKQNINDVQKIDTSKWATNTPELSHNKEIVNTLLDQFNMVSHTQKTLDNLNALADLITNIPDDSPFAHRFPQAWLDKIRALDRTNIRDLSAKDLQNVRDALKFYDKVSKDEISNLHSKQTTSIQEARDNAIARLERPESKPAYGERPGFVDIAKKGARPVKDFFGGTQERLDYTVASWSKDGQLSPMHDIIAKDVTKSILAQRDKNAEYQAQLKAVVRSEKIDSRSWPHALVEFVFKRPDGTEMPLTLTRGEAMELKANWDASGSNRDSIINGFKLPSSKNPNELIHLSESELAKVIEWASKDQKIKSVMDMGDKYFEQSWQEMNAVNQKINGFDLPKEDKYFPTEKVPEGQGKVAPNQIVQKSTGRFTVDESHLTEKTGSTAPLVIRGYFRRLLDSFDFSSKYIAQKEASFNAAKLFYDPKFTAAIVDRFGQKAWNDTQRNLQRAFGMMDNPGEFGKAMLYLRRMFIPMKIGLKTSTALINEALAIRALRYSSLRNVVQGTVEYQLRRRMIRNELRQYSPAFRDVLRSGTGTEMYDVLQRSQGAMAGLKSKILKVVMYPTKLAISDASAVEMHSNVLQARHEFATGKISEDLIAATGIRTKEQFDALSPNDKQIAVHQFGDYAFMHTHASSLPTFMSTMIQMGWEGKTIATFSSEMNAMWNMFREAATDFRHKPSASKGSSLLRAAALAYVLEPLIINSIKSIGKAPPKPTVSANASPEEKKKEAQKAFADEQINGLVDNAANMLIGAGDVMYAVKNKLKNGPFATGDDLMLIDQMYGQATDMAANAFKALTDKNNKTRRDSQKKAVDSLLELTSGTVFGFPYRNVVNLPTGIHRLIEGK